METQNLFRMYFGRNIGPDNRVIGLEVTQFIHRHIAPVFPGFTVYQGKGFWEEESEDCFIVEIIAEGAGVAMYDIRIICNAYKKRFNQDAVLVTHQSVNMELV